GGLAARSSARGLLESAGVKFPEGSTAVFDAASSTLVVKNTQSNLDAVAAFVEPTLRKVSEGAGREWGERGTVSGKQGLISLELEVPTAGRILEFRGHQKPGAVTLRYESWEWQMRQSVLWAVLGLLLFFVFGRRRAWLRSIAVALLLTCVPLAL